MERLLVLPLVRSPSALVIAATSTVALDDGAAAGAATCTLALDDRAVAATSTVALDDGAAGAGACAFTWRLLV
jgi:hypothetical protein